jgi:M6 family metalloprotease-like protein
MFAWANIGDAAAGGKKGVSMRRRLEEGAPPKRHRLANAAIGAALGIGLVFGSAGVALAIPAYNQAVKVSQGDGGTATITTHGDEWFHYATNSDDVVVQKDPSDGVWKQVVGSGSSLSLGAAAQDGKASNAISATDLNTTEAREAYYKLGGQSYSGKTESSAVEEGPITLSDIKASQSKATGSGAAARPSSSNQTSLPLLTIVVGFKDEAYSNDFDWNNTFFTGKYSVASLYSQSSEGKFTWRPAEETSANGVDGNTNTADKANDGVVHVTLDQDYGKPDPWGVPGSDGYNDYINDMEAAIKAAAKYVDFSQYDTDGDGTVEADELGLGVVFAGYEAATGVIPTGHNGIWSHQSSFSDMTGSAYKVTDASGKTIGIDRYIVQSENESMSAGEQHQSGIGALGHELGHFLGLPDLYNVGASSGAWSNYSTFYLSIMDYGSYGCVDHEDGTREYRPTFFDPYSRYLLGYITPEEITKDGTYTATSETDPSGYKSYIIRVSDDEYYLIENREYESFDAGMEPYYAKGDGTIENKTGGIVVWHIDNGIATSHGYATATDPSLANTVNDWNHRPGVMENYFEYAGYTAYPNLYAPFLNATENAAYGASKLSLYNGSDDPSARTDTGITVTSTDEGSTSMRFTVDFPDVTIAAQPSGALYTTGAKATALSVDLSGNTDDVTYQWMKSTDGGKTWEKVATSDTYVPSTAKAGDTQYKVVATNSFGYKAESEAVTVSVADPVEAGGMYRLYNPNTGEHFYTASAYEAGVDVKAGWRYEGIGWYAPKTSSTPVYRLYNPNAGDHHYTTSAAERDMLVKAGWRDEGIGWYSDDAKGVAVYREYNPNATSGAHNFTTNKAEDDMLASAGWNQEGIAWYGVKR